jgi:2-hydroxycyclohexanecarboxyl-CoA dehydrogenase
MLTNGDGRVALVTGGARGIGAAIAAGLAEDGLAVAIADTRLEEAQGVAGSINDAGGQAVAIEINITDGASVDAGLAVARERFGQVDVLVNNAGWDELKLFLATDEDFWERVLDINFKGALRLTQAVLPEMMERRWGRIINIGSDAGRVGSSLEAVYSGAKGGVIAFTKTVAREIARTGVTANVVCPGPTQTAFLQEVVDQHENADGVIASMVKSVPMRRLARPEEIAAAVRFFADQSASFITGQTLSVSGGLTMA